MNRFNLSTGVSACAITLIALVAAPAHAFDEEAAKALAKKNDCTKCHAIDREKKAPSYKKIAEKYKGKPDGEEKAIKNMTTGPKVKLEDGTEEEHKIIKLDLKKPEDVAAIKNLSQWILAQ
jgi:cytochrome c